MITFTLYGASDDLMEVSAKCAETGEPVVAAEKYNEPGEFTTSEEYSKIGDPGQCLGRFRIEAPDETKLEVWATYNGTWAFAPAMDPDSDDGHDFPEWPIRHMRHAGTPYSMEIQVDAPDGSTLVHASRENEK